MRKLGGLCFDGFWMDWEVSICGKKIHGKNATETESETSKHEMFERPHLKSSNNGALQLFQKIWVIHKQL